MKLLRLTSNQTQAFFDNTLNQDLILNPGTQIALQSLALQIDVNQLVIDASNNGMTFQFTENGQVNHVFFAHGIYTLLNYSDFFADMTISLNSYLSAFAPGEIGYEWMVDLDPSSKKLFITTKKAEAQAFLDFADDKNLGVANVSKTTPSSKALHRDGGTTGTNDSFVFSNLPIARGAGTFRARIQRFGECAIVLTKKPVLSTFKVLPYETCAFGIILTTSGEAVNTYKFIIDGKVITPEPGMDGEIIESLLKDTMCIDVVQGNIVGSVYSEESQFPMTLFEIQYDNITELYPSIVFKGQNAELNMCASTPSPFYNITSVNTNSTDDESLFNDSSMAPGLTKPPRPYNQATKKYISFDDIRLANICGFKNNRIPIDGYKTGIDETWSADNIFTVGALNQSYTVQLLNINIPSSFDTLSHQRNNTLATINTSVQDNTRLTYECNFPIWLDLNNANAITQRNWKARVLFEDNSVIPTIGFSQMTILIKDKNE
jgi:hypothetical protein